MAGVRSGMQIKIRNSNGKPIRPAGKLSAGQAMFTSVYILLQYQFIRSTGLPIGQLPIISPFLTGTVRNRPLPVVLPNWSLKPIWSGLRASMGAHSPVTLEQFTTVTLTQK